MNTVHHQHESPWPYRLARVLVCATFPLIWVGSLVTTTVAGMAVPDWPDTYGYNLFLYPWQTWIFGPWDLFVEHGHRLFGALVGILTIGLFVAVWLRDNGSRRWMRMVALVALVLVILQGMIGGVRVLAVERTLAMIHGCVGPAFFALCAAMAVFLSPLWRNGLWRGETPRNQDPAASKLHRISLVTLALAYVQIVFGALVRHVPLTASSGTFRAAVLLHLFMAFVLTIHIAMLCWHVFRNYHGVAALWRPAAALGLLMGIQLGLGAATWVVKFGWPVWIGEQRWNAGFIVMAESWFQTNVITAHVATGSLILVTSLVLALRGLRLMRGVPERDREFSSVRIGVFA